MRLVAALALLAACGDDLGPTAVPLRSGPATIVLGEGGTELVLVRDTTTLLVLPAAGFQIGTVDDLEAGSFDPYWLFVERPPEPPAGLRWHSVRALRVLASSEQHLVLALDHDGGSGTLRLQRSTPGSFSAVFSARGDGDPVAYLRLAADADPTEGFYGLGEWGDRVDHRGTLRPMQLEVDLELESSNNENHVPVPLLVGTRGWGVFVASDRPGVFDVARASDTRIDVTFGTGDASDEGLALHLFTADAPLDVLKPYYEAAGYPGLPAPWAYGPLLWRDETASQAQMLDDIQQIRARDLATSGVWFDRPYATGVNTFDWNPVKFPSPATMLQALRDEGLRYAIWQAPYVAAADNDQDVAPEQHAYAQANGFFPPLTGLLVNQWGKPIDFTNDAAYAWWKDNLRIYTETYGVEGFKLDYAEDVVLGINGQRVQPWLFADGSDERTMHHGYTMLYHQIHREMLPASGGLLLTRTGRWGDQVNGMIIWPGDLDADLSRLGDPIPGESTKAVGGLPTALAFGLGLSASGFPFYASDTGGYRRSPPSNETWLRWVEANAVWPAMQVGDSSSEMPWEFTARNGRTTESLDIYRRYARLHMRLFPYAWSYATAMRETGHPIVRPLGLAYPELGLHPADQYMFGEHVLVAPVITAGATSREVVFPPGVWIDWWSGAEQVPGARSVAADLATLPLYVARGGIVPMLRDTIDTLAPVAGTSSSDSYANDPGILVVRVAPGPEPTAFTVFDGTTIAQAAGASELSFTAGTRFARGALFEIIARPAAPTVVRRGSASLTEHASFAALAAATDGWFHDASATGGTLWIKVDGNATVDVQ